MYDTPSTQCSERLVADHTQSQTLLQRVALTTTHGTSFVRKRMNSCFYTPERAEQMSTTTPKSRISNLCRWRMRKKRPLPMTARTQESGYRRPVSATYTSNSDATPGTIRFDYLVDASGRAGLLSNKYQKTRQWNRGLNNIAYWGYWRGTKKYAPGTARENSPYIEALHGMYIALSNVLTHLITLVSRWKRLGMVHTSTQRHNIRGVRHESRLCNIQEKAVVIHE